MVSVMAVCVCVCGRSVSVALLFIITRRSMNCFGARTSVRKIYVSIYNLHKISDDHHQIINISIASIAWCTAADKSKTYLLNMTL